MASTSLPSIKTTTSPPATTSSKTSENSSSLSAGGVHSDLSSSTSARNSLGEDDNDQASSGDEWGMEIGNLIIDLDADLQKDEMKEKSGNTEIIPVRNTNNNNSIKGSNSPSPSAPSVSQSPKLAAGNNMNTSSKQDSINNTGKHSKLGSRSNSPAPNAGKKSKSKKSKSGNNTKLSGNVPMPSSEAQVAKDGSGPNTMATAVRVGKPDFTGNPSGFLHMSGSNNSMGKGKYNENTADLSKSGSKSSKSSRNYKKHGKNNSNTADKKADAGTPGLAGTSANKDGREKPSKAGKSNKHQSHSSVSNAVSAPNITHSMGAFRTHAGSGSMTSTMSKNNAPSFSSVNANPNFSNHCPVMSTEGQARTNPQSIHSEGKDAQFGKTELSRSNEAPIMSVAPHLGKHRKTSSMPSAMKYPTPFSMPIAVSSQNQSLASITNSPLTAATELRPGQISTPSGKRERIQPNTSLASSNSKKIKLEKDGKSYNSNSGMTPTDGENTIAKPGTASTAMSTAAVSLPGHYTKLNENIMPKLTDMKSDKKTRTVLSSTTNFKSKTAKSEPGSLLQSVEPSGSNTPQNGAATPAFKSSESENTSANKRTVGTVTTYADVGVATEPEALGPCEPGTCVSLSGIVWHETESGILVVNVTWRNRSYVGTLLDATKHDWAPPRIPDADSDVEFRVKSGRPKRQRGNGNGSGADVGGRKGRKSAIANNGDDYKSSPSSNKRRSNKMSESDACSGNDGEICTTPSKSAKRARMSRSAAAKQASQKTANSTTTKEATSGDATSGSGSSACSSPVFMECPYANCKKRYKDDDALKYHEAHAHPGEDAEDAEKSGQDADSLTADSPKDSDNMSTKSNEELPTSESNGSPPVTENEPVSTQSKPAPDSHQAMDTTSSNQAPFVITQPSGQIPTEQFQASAQPVPMETSFVDKHSTNESSTLPSEYPVTSQDQSKSSDGVISPYTLTDSQTNESISLKNHGQSSKTSRPYHTVRPTSTYAEQTQQQVNEPGASVEATSAVDNESALAVKTLLQLQDSQDQLPGLTSYNQSSQAMSMSTSTPMTTDAPVQSHPTHAPTNTSIPSSMPTSIDTQMPGKMQHEQHVTSSPFRGHAHSKDGSPLPRMSVGISTSRSTGNIAGQYVSLSGFPTSHGTVTANTTQEGIAHYTPSGQRTVKGKTVPIPTDPQQTITPPSQAASGSITPGSANALKKQKRKKPPKMEPGKSPTDTVPKPIPTHPSSRPPYREEVQKPPHPSAVKVKQELHYQQGVPPTSAHQKISQDAPKHHMMSHQPRQGEIKQEHGPKVPPQGAPHPRPGPGFIHSNVPHGQRPQAYPHPDYPNQGAEQGGNKNNNNKLTPVGQEAAATHSAPHPIPHSQRGPSPSFSNTPDSRDHHARSGSDVRPRSHLAVPPGSSHSLPGSRSLTPVNQPPVQQHRPNPAAHREGVPPQSSQPGSEQHPAPSQQRRPSSKESGSPPPPLDRRLSMEELKQSPMSISRAAAFAASPAMQQLFSGGLYNQYRYVPAPSGYDLARYQFMNDPQFQQHYENVIQQEMSKDQNAEGPSEQRAGTPASRNRLTPSPNPQARPTARTKSPRPEERSARGDSPNRGQHFPPQQHGVPPQASRGPQAIHPQHLQPHHQQLPRVSPVPQASHSATPNKLGPAAPPGSRGLSPHPQATPPPMVGARPARPNSEAERCHHRREHSAGERPSTASRISNMTPSRKPTPKEGYPEHRPQTPEKGKSGPPTSVYASPGVHVSAMPPGARTPVQYYATSLFDPRSMPPYAAAFPAYAMFPPGAPIFPGHWPQGAPPGTVVPGAPGKVPSESPHSGKPPRERSPSGARSPYRDEMGRRSHGEVRGREGEPYPISKERRTSDGPMQIRKSVTPDPKTVPVRNATADGSSGTATPPTQRHHHTHHHIHEGIPILPHQYQYPMASAVMAGSEAAAATLAPAALAPFPKRDIP